MKTLKIKTAAEGESLLDVIASVMSGEKMIASMREQSDGILESSEKSFDVIDGCIVEYADDESSDPIYWSIVSVDEDDAGVKTVQLDC